MNLSHSWLIITVALFTGLGICGAQAKTLRIVSYNVDCSDQSSDGNITNAFHSLPTVVEGIGLHHRAVRYFSPLQRAAIEQLRSTAAAKAATVRTSA